MLSLLQYTGYAPRFLVLSFLTVSLLLFVPAAATAADYGTLHLRVVDEDAGTPLTATFIRIEDQIDDFITDEQGELEVRLPEGRYTVEIERLTYRPARIVAAIEAGRTTFVEVTLEPQGAAPRSTTVATTARRLGPSHIYQPTTSLSGEELQRNLSSSVPATLDAIPGFDAQFNGPGASSPTIRGMPGDRVLMLEDGHRTGDIYWTAADHGVMVEPLSAQRIEVIRGPSGLLFGSNALGGVVNVIRDDVPIYHPETLEGSVGTHFESVNNGFGVGASLRGPVGPFAYYGEATFRNAQDTRTPLGTLEQTELTAHNLGAGFSWLPEWGVFGAAFRHYENVYGVPGDFNGQLIPGGHPGGVTIEATRQSARFHAEYQEPVAIFENICLRTNYTRYLHDEIEAVLGDEVILGARFHQHSTDTHLMLTHLPLGGNGENDWRSEGAFGLSLQTRDLAASGASPGTRSGQERTFGFFAFEEIGRAPFRLQTGLRYDFRHVTTEDRSPLEVRTRERRIIREVSPRSFGAFSGSLAALYDFGEHWTLGLSLARSFRSPTIEELYSDGPHLANFSFDIGNPDLEPERGLGADLFLRSELPRLNLELAAYYNRVDGYIYYSPTGETVRVFREYVAPRVTPVFEARGDDALFVGAEGRVQWEFIEDFTLDISASYTQATRIATGDPLPSIPPLSGRIEARYDGRAFFGAVGSNLSAPQNRVPRPITVGDSLESPQAPTDGYALLNAMAGWRHRGELADHTIMIQAQNVTDQVYRNHLSRTKDVAPQPGRNLQISYRARF